MALCKTIFRLLSLGAVAGAGVVGMAGCAGPEPTAATPTEATAPEPIRADRWTYVEVDSAKAMWGEFDEPAWLRYFGLAAGDLDGDGYLDLVSGRNAYYNPGGDMSGPWRKVDLGVNADANLIYRTTGAKQPFILAERLPDVLRFSVQPDGTIGQPEVVAQVPPTGHHNGQGYKMADLLPGRGDDEIIYASQGGLYVMDPTAATPWPAILVGKDASDEGVGVADLDGDGDLDLIAGYRVPGQDAEVPTVVVWFENPGSITPDWRRHPVGRTEFATDRVESADLDGDGRNDVVVSEERYPGLEPDANLWVFLQRDTGFVRQRVVTQFSMNNLDLADVDRDGDVDILTAEHKGPALTVQAWLNDGSAAFTPQTVDTGKESHLGTRTYDLDGDGDLDLVSIGWDQHKFVHVWRNDALSK